MSRDKLKLTALLLIVALPVSLATWMFHVTEMTGVGRTTNRGVLIMPVLDVTELALRDDSGTPLFTVFEEAVAGISVEDYQARPWMMVYLGAAFCDETCAERQYFLRQLHRRLGRDSGRVERWYAIVSDAPTMLQEETRELFIQQFSDLRLAWAERNELLENLARVIPAGADPVAEHYIFVVDPVGNVMLYFTPENDAEDILTDIDRLLDRSSLG